MLIKPGIQDITIITCLKRDYGLRIVQLTFLPLGGDLCSAVYQAVADDETSYFCKLRCGDFDEISVELPKFLDDQGISQIIPPLVSKSGRLWIRLGAYNLILYPFVDGTSGFTIELEQRQWVEFGTALKRIHTTVVPPALSRKIRKEDFSPERREMVRKTIQRLDKETFDDPVTAGLAAYLLPKRETVLDLIVRAELFSHTLALKPPEFVLCHSDIHPGNLHIDTKGTLFIVDWDYPVLAPKECDLMFVGGGQGYMNTTAEQEETFFYRNYGDEPVDPIAMAYYRCERNLIDLSVETTRIFSSTGSDQDRAQSLQIITWLFGPGGSIEMAYKAASYI